MCPGHDTDGEMFTHLRELTELCGITPDDAVLLSWCADPASIAPEHMGCLVHWIRLLTEDPGAAVWRARAAPGKPDYWEVSDCPAALPRTMYGCGTTEGAALLWAIHECFAEQWADRSIDANGD